jgi:hypothetical protein
VQNNFLKNELGEHFENLPQPLFSKEGEKTDLLPLPKEGNIPPPFVKGD